MWLKLIQIISSFKTFPGIRWYNLEEIAAIGETLNIAISNDKLHRLRDAVRTKRPEKWRTNSWLLLHDNAPAHRPVLVKVFLTKSIVTTPEHPPSSPDQTPADF